MSAFVKCRRKFKTRSLKPEGCGTRRPMLRDPNDDMVFEAAVNGSADLLVTFNKGDFDAVALGKMRLASPGEALRLLEGSHEKK